AVYANKTAALPEEERDSFIAEERDEDEKDIDIYKLASEMVIDGIVHPNNLREALKGQFEMYMSKYQVFTDRKHPVYPV
ncbi:carboxyl transferase domain-containing protein, partial [Bacillus tropicus]|uniref:carboxyl transferase domain-containing protein n=1 Tax=Bacillus tropicus TaxID=2026188 RepID=UPI0028466A19|nr:acyl-CoA carboxylase subunit beta [Bacillus tropicus]